MTCSRGRAYSGQTKENIKRTLAIVAAFWPINTAGTSDKMPMVSARTVSTYLRKLRDRGEIRQTNNGMWVTVINRRTPNEDWWLADMPNAGKSGKGMLPQGENIQSISAQEAWARKRWCDLAENFPSKWTPTSGMAKLFGIETSSAFSAMSRMRTRRLIESRPGPKKELEWRKL